MDKKDFKNLFDKTCQEYAFNAGCGGWFKESTECLIVLDLQKSNYGDYFELNIKIFIQMIFGQTYTMNKDLVKKALGTIFIRQPNIYSGLFNLENNLDDSERARKLEEFFIEFLTPFSNRALTKTGLKQLSKEGKILLLPGVANALATL